MSRRAPVCLVAVLALAACAGSRPRQPIGASQSIVMARVVFKGQLPNFLRHPADEVYYARVTERGDLDLDHPMVADYHKDGYSYWLNAPAGRYVPVAAAYSALGLRYLARLDDETRKEMAVEVRPGAVVFAGSTLAKTEWQGFGPAALNLLRHIQGCLPWLGRPTDDIDQVGHQTDRSPASEGAALRSAARALRGTAWQDAVRGRYGELSPPPPALYRGLVFRKAVPRVQLEHFSYLDVVGWGQPRKARDAVEWRERKGRAAISAAFLKEGDAGVKPLQAYLDDMRAAGSAEDAHILYEVKVSSRSARAVRYTTYVYSGQAMPGGRPVVMETQTIVVPEEGGYFLMRYRAKRDDFAAYLPTFMKFLEYLVFERKPPPQPQT